MIYLDNAATGGFKPNESLEYAETVMRHLSANPGRSGHRLSLAGERIVYSARETFAKELNCTEERVIFTKNCTEALNLAIFGTVKRGGHVITTAYEHNSVLRPLHFLKENGVISLDIVEESADKDILSAIKEKITDKTYLVVTTAVSNVTGKTLPVKKIGEFLQPLNVKYLVDGAQGGGHVKLSLSNGINMLAFAGHKGLCGIMGSGVLSFDEKTEVSPLLFGGTGTNSFSLKQPEEYPERLESGTLNLPAIASLSVGAKYAFSHIAEFSEYLSGASAKIIDELKNEKEFKVYSEPNPAGIVAFSVDGFSSFEIADILNEKYDIAVRAGLHCAPLYHRLLNTTEGGLVRVSLAVQNGRRDIETFLSAVKSIKRR